MVELRSEAPSAPTSSAQPASSLSALLSTGLHAYDTDWQRGGQPSGLPAPNPTMPLRVLTSIGTAAQVSMLGSQDSEPDLGTRAWLDLNRPRLEQLVPEAFVLPPLWIGWSPPEVLSSGSVVINWSELELLAAQFARDRTPGVTSLAFVLVRDWAFRFLELWQGHSLDGVLDDLLARIATRDDRPLIPELGEIQSYEREVLAATGAEVSTVWSAAIAMSLGKGPLVPYGFVDDRVPSQFHPPGESQVVTPPTLPDPVEPVTSEADETVTSEADESAASEADESAASEADEAATSEAETETPDTEPGPVPQYRPSTAITSDLATADDALNYELYADAIAEFIADDRTTAPLTIGIKAPWGAGKSSLMKMIRRKLDPHTEARPEDDGRRLENRRVLEECKKPPDKAAGDLALDALDEQGRRTTIWFNAWKYQSGDQLWAGLAHAIISQVEQRMTVYQREKFWASLNLQRFDMGEVRRRIYAAFLGRIAGYAVALPLLIVALVFAAVWESVYAAGGALAVAVAIALDIFRRWRSFVQESAAASNPQLVRDPGYEGRLGFLHLVHEDLHRVLSLVASPERPLVVFIDDLDRCSYTTVAQVIEALNTFLAGDFKNCTFVIAMEPELVAAQIHVAYRDLFEHMAERTGHAADDLGWRFLEKMVQLPLALPPPHDAQMEDFVSSLMGGVVLQVPDLPADDKRMIQATALIQQNRGDDTSLQSVGRALEQTEAELAQSAGPSVINEAIVQRAAQRVYASEFDDRRPEVQALVLRHAADLDRNPREIKRFLNLLRFYAYVAFWRESAHIAAPDLDGVAKLAVLSVRYPQLLTSLGADDVLRSLEGAAGTASAWKAALKRLPDRFRAELEGTPELRQIIGREPMIGDRAAGFL